MSYQLPAVLVYEDFTTVPAAVARPLRAHIAGGHAHLRRYAVESERNEALLGYYDRVLDTPYHWPGRPAGAKVDLAYTKLWIKDALLLYFSDSVGGGSAVTKVAGYNNRVRSASVSFAANGDYDRDASLLDRDVRPGDVAKVRGFDGGGDPVTLWTTVQSLKGDPVAATVGAATTDASNPATRSMAASSAYVSGPQNCVVLDPDATGYDGLADGDIDETYDILVTDSSVNGDFTKATLRVISGSGRDDVASVTPEAAGVPTAIGTRGLFVTFDVDPSGACSASAAADDVSPDDLVAGQRHQVTVRQAFTKPAPTSGGTYTGASDVTYVVTVSRGGFYGAALPPQISVTTTTGLDVSGPTTVTAAAHATAVGSRGVTVAFSGTALRKGDRYYVTADAAAEGPMRVIVLSHNLDTTIPGDSEVDLTLFIRKPLLQVGRNREGFAPLTNWDASATELTVNSAITAFDETWTDGGVPEPLDVYSEASKGYGAVYAEYRAWLSDLASETGGIIDPADLNALIPGPLDPDNPLKYGVFKTLETANGVEVKFTAVADPDDPTSWVDTLEKLVGRDDVYNLVPLSHNKTVQDLYAAHVVAMSSPESGLWRGAWFSLEGVPVAPVVSAGSAVPGHLGATTSDGKVCLAVVEDDPDTSGTQYNRLRVTSGNGNFITNGVRPNDVARIEFAGDGFGGETYSEYVIDSVHSEDEVLLLSGPDAPISVAAKVEIWRSLSPTEEANAVAVTAGAWGNRRIVTVWPDVAGSGGTMLDGMFVCCSLAGQASGILPQQGMTHLQLTGYDDLTRTYRKFNKTQLDAMAEAGVWIVTQDPTTGTVFTRHAVTTGSTDDLNQREEVRRRNADSVAYRFKETYEPFIGVTNVTPSNQGRLRLLIDQTIDSLKSEFDTNVNVGPQLISATVVSFGRHTVLHDRYVLKLTCDGPFPLNNFEIHLAF